jgi:glycerol-3-phosphate O-acyltransferase
MHNLGAYKVDRRRKHKLYNDMLKSYSTVAMTEGVNSLFFPEGSRSSSGEIGNKLKLGLLGTTIEAQRINLMKDVEKAKKIYILPITLNYHYVLEASKLIERQLKEDGKEQYFPDENTGYFGLIKRAYKVITSNPGMTISLAPMLDVLGNPVNQKGESIGKKGEIIKIEDYFKVNGKITKNIQRDMQYTQILGEKIVKEYKVNSVVLSSNLVAFVAFEILRKRFNQFSVYELLSLPLDEANISVIEFKIILDRIRDRVKVLAKNSELIISEDINLPIEELMQVGVKKVGSAHPKKVLKINRKGEISTKSMKLLYYYRNKLNCYKLDKYI